MDFLTFITNLLAVLSGLAANWPTLAITVFLIPAVVNLAKFVSLKWLHINWDGYSAYVVFGLNLIAFGGYGYLVWSGIGLAGVEPIVTALATIITALLGLLGGLASKLAYQVAWSKAPGALGFKFSSLYAIGYGKQYKK